MSLSEQDHQSLSNVHVGRLGISRLDDLKGLTSDDKHKLIEFIVLTSNKPGIYPIKHLQNSCLMKSVLTMTQKTSVFKACGVNGPNGQN